jgi:hypothetical protein
MPLVSKPASFACRAERLARATSGPDWFVVGPACEPEGIGPAADSGEEMALGVSAEFGRDDIFDGPLVYFPRRYEIGLDEFA